MDEFEKLKEIAKEKGLAISSYGVNLAALDSSARSGTGSASLDYATQIFLSNCELARNEKQFQETVVGIARHLGWKVVHIRRVLVKMGDRTHYETPFDLDGAGSFDLDFYRERLVKAELKYGKNKPQDNQLEWKKRYDEANIENYIWYPSDANKILEVLSCRRPVRK